MLHLLIVGTQACFHISNTESATLVRRDGRSFLVKFPLPIVFSFVSSKKEIVSFLVGRVLSGNKLGSPHKFVLVELRVLRVLLLLPFETFF
jgi:hypothetical protein